MCVVGVGVGQHLKWELEKKQLAKSVCHFELAKATTIESHWQEAGKAKGKI